MKKLPCVRWRRNGLALCLATAAWASGCVHAKPGIEPSFASRKYTPARIAILPPDVFMILDKSGDNDPKASAALGRQVMEDVTRYLEPALRARGYDTSLAARWDGVYGGDGQMLVTAQDLGYLADSILAYSNAEAGQAQGPLAQPAFVAPQLAARVGGATASDALLYLNLKGVSVARDKRVNQVVGTVFIAVVVAVVIAAIVLSNKGGGKSGNSGGSSAGGGATGGGRTITRAVPAGTAGGVITQSTTAPLSPPPSGYGRYRSGGYGPSFYSGVNVMVPIVGSSGPPPGYPGGPAPAPPPRVAVDDPVHTRQGVEDVDDWFAGDEVHLSLTLVNARDGRVLWHIRDHFDVDAAKPEDVKKLCDHYIALIPPSLALDKGRPIPAQPLTNTAPPAVCPR